MTKLRLTKEQYQSLLETRDAINALVPEAGDAFLKQVELAPDRDYAKTPSKLLGGSFPWATTLQGYSFWEAIWKELVAQEKRDDA